MSEDLMSLSPGRNVSIRKAAAIMGKSEQFIRVCLQREKLPFGTAVKVSSKWNYYISPKLFAEYVGLHPGDEAPVQMQVDEPSE